MVRQVAKLPDFPDCGKVKVSTMADVIKDRDVSGAEIEKKGVKNDKNVTP